MTVGWKEGITCYNLKGTCIPQYKSIKMKMKYAGRREVFDKILFML